MHAEQSDKVEALNSYDRLAGLPVTAAQSQSFLQPILRAAKSRLSQKGWLAGAADGGASGGGEPGEFLADADVED